MNKPETKIFSYQVDVESVPLNADTAEYYFGEGAVYNPDFSEDSFSKDILHEMVKDAITYVLQAKMQWIARNKIEDVNNLKEEDKQYWQYLEEKEQQYRQIEKSIKLLNTTKS